jgi:hypothetical protein
VETALDRSLCLIIAILQGIVSSLSLVINSVLVMLMVNTTQVFAQDLTGLPPTLKGLILLGWIISLWGGVTAVGLGTWQRWGWLGALIFQGLCLMIYQLIVLLTSQTLSSGLYLTSGLCLVAMVVLRLPRIRQQYDAGPALPASNSD